MANAPMRVITAAAMLRHALLEITHSRYVTAQYSRGSKRRKKLFSYWARRTKVS
jgi:ABC-type dipeptide/oligopeptide/nickel transport system permease component